MKRTAFLAALAGLWGCALPGTGRVEAGFIPAIDTSNATAAEVGDSATDGYSFLTGNALVTIDALGLLSASPPSGETVRIFQDGTTTNLASVAIPSNAPVSAPSPQGNLYSYEAITPLTLLPNMTYDIVVDYNGPEGVLVLGTPVANVPGVSFGAPRGALGDGQFPTGDAFALPGSYFGPTFEVATATPEPASLTLLGLGAAGLLGYDWRRRKRTA
jgi:hypothetical protein